MVVAIPIEDVAAAADVMFLLLFLQVNYAVIRLRNEFGDRLDYGYLMPFYPWVPIIGIITKAFLAVYLFRFSPLAWFYAAGWIIVGVAVFFAYARSRVAADDEPRITYEDKRGVRSGRAVLAPVANPGHVDTVVRVAAALAAARDALNVVRIPQTLSIAEGRGYTYQAESQWSMPYALWTMSCPTCSCPQSSASAGASRPSSTPPHGGRKLT